MHRSLEDTFTRVEELHLYMSHSAEYHRHTLSERDKIIADVLGLKQRTISNARLGTGDFSIFKNDADLYFAHNSRWSANKLLEIVQYAIGTLRSEKKYSHEPLKALDEIVASWLGVSRVTVTYARLGLDKFRRLRGCVNPEFRDRPYNGAKITCEKVRQEYVRRAAKPGFLELPIPERDKIIAKHLNLKPATIREVRLGLGHYKGFTKFSAP